MRRFSDRLTSSSSAEQGKGAFTSLNIGSSDESLKVVAGETMGSSDRDREYAALVEILGLHQIVNALEAEYHAITGGYITGSEDHNSKTGIQPTHAELVKRAAELRDILGLARCSSLLSHILAQQHSKNNSAESSMHTAASRPMERTSSNLRAEANEWTPPSGTDSPRTVLKKVLNIQKPGESPSVGTPPGLLSPFVEYTPTAHVPLAAPVTYYLAPPTSPPSEAPSDLSWDGKQFISSLALKRDRKTSSMPQKPIDPLNKVPSTPPGLAPPQSQKLHSFPLVASLLPQTFSVHLLSALHMRFQLVATSLEMLDAAFANEIKKMTSTQNLSSTRWETWMTPAGMAGMSRTLMDLRKALDELGGETARAGWIVDTWGAYQGGKLDGSSRSPESGLGSAAIDGVEIGRDAEMRSGLQAPIGRPHSEKGKLPSTTSEGAEIAESERPLTCPPPTKGKITPIFSGTGTFRPPPGLAFPLKPTGGGGQMSRTVNGSRHFPSTTCVSEGDSVGSYKEFMSRGDRLERHLVQQRGSTGGAATDLPQPAKHDVRNPGVCYRRECV